MLNVKIGIIGGSGLDDPDILEDRTVKTVETPFGQPSDALIVGKIDGIECVLLARHGRKHSIMPGNVNYRANVWALKQEGCTHIIASTATGSLQEHILPGDIIILDSFIDRTSTRSQTFYDGAEQSPVGVAHLPMEPAFCNKTRDLLVQTLRDLTFRYHDRGTVVAIEGPRFSSKAESLLFKQWGGDVINMTTVPEVVLAKEAGICYASIAMATDYDCWRNVGEPVNAKNVLEVFQNNVIKIKTIIKTVIPKIAKEDWNETIEELKKVLQTSILVSE